MEELSENCGLAGKKTRTAGVQNRIRIARRAGCV